MAVNFYKNVSGMEMDVPSESGSTIRVPINKYVGGSYYSFLDNDPKWEKLSYSPPFPPDFVSLYEGPDLICFVRDVFGYTRVEPHGSHPPNGPGVKGDMYLVQEAGPNTNELGACVVTAEEATPYPAYTGFALGVGDGNTTSFAGPSDFNSSEPYALYLDGVEVTVGTQAIPEDVFWNDGTSSFDFTVAPGLDVDITLDYSDNRALQTWVSVQYPATVTGPGV